MIALTTIGALLLVGCADDAEDPAPAQGEENNDNDDPTPGQGDGNNDDACQSDDDCDNPTLRQCQDGACVLRECAERGNFCLEAPGCVLDLNDEGAFECREPTNDCEAQVGEPNCQATEGCTFYPGECFCPPNLDCVCGGGPPPICRETGAVVPCRVSDASFFCDTDNDEECCVVQEDADHGICTLPGNCGDE